MSRRQYQPGTLKFIVIAIVFMLLVDHFVFSGKRSYIEEAKQAAHREEVAKQVFARNPARATPEGGAEFFEAPIVEPLIQEEPEIAKAPETPVPPPEKTKPSKEAVPPAHHGEAKIAIIIDDLGMDLKHSREAIDLPAPITMAFLPYAPKTREYAVMAKDKGHTLIIHAPMEAMDSAVNIGPGGLKADMSAGDFQAAFGKMMGSFDGYAGINNHMGSRLTQDKDAMDRLMGILAVKKLFFVDSKTIESSVAAQEAAEKGVPYAERDVFLDHVETREFVNGALAKAERIALRKGSAIAIGHPKEVTLAALRAWIPTLKAKGIELVSVKSLLRVPKVEAIPPTKEEENPVPDMFPEEMSVSPASEPMSALPAPQPLPPPAQ